MQIVCFEDELTAQLAPITTGRPAYAIHCASFSLLDWLQRLKSPVSAYVRPHLTTIQELDYQLTPISDPLARGPLLLVNARLVPSQSNASVLSQLMKQSQPCQISDPTGLLAAVVPAGWQSDSPAQGGDQACSFIEALRLAGQQQPATAARLTSFQWPHDVVQWHMRLMAENLQLRLLEGDYQQMQDGVFVASGAKIGSHAIIDTKAGPILLDEDVQVGPFCYLSGPVYAGPSSRIIEHAALKDGVALGSTVKIGGEVEASIIESFSNKQHHGFLGHSYLGSWINLGAGTCNSDLKNTYGKINMEYQGQRVSTDMQFMGCVMGDYAKTAINTGIFTGKVIGVASMLYGFVTSNVPSFVNYARLFGQTAEIPAEVMISTQARMFQRRKVQQRDCDQQLIRDMFTITAAEREQGESMTLG